MCETYRHLEGAAFFQGRRRWTQRPRWGVGAKPVGGQDRGAGHIPLVWCKSSESDQHCSVGSQSFQKETRDCKSLCCFAFPPMVLPPSRAEELSRSSTSLCSQEAGWLLNPILVTPGQSFTRVRTASSTGLLTQRNATEMRTRNWSIPIICEKKCSSILNYRKWGWDSTAEKRSVV